MESDKAKVKTRIKARGANGAAAQVRLFAHSAGGSVFAKNLIFKGARGLEGALSNAGARGALRALLHGAAFGFARPQGALVKLEGKKHRAAYCCRARMCCGRRIAA